MHTWVQQCPHCDFCAPDISRAPADARILESEAYRAAIQDRRYPELARRFLAYAVAIADSDPGRAARACLQAAWVCDDARHSNQAVEARLRAAEWFGRLQPFPDTEEGLTTGAQFVDVLRRIGQLPSAAAECKTLLRRESCSGVVRRVLEYQRRLISAGDTAAHKVAESGA